MSNHKKSTIITKGSDKPAAAKSRHYVDNKEFLAALVERKKIVTEALANNKPKPQLSEYIGSCILKIAEGVGKHRSFRQKPYIDDMIGDGIHNCIRYVDNFDPTITENPFAYFTQICSYACIHRIEIEEKNTVVKFKSILNSISQGDHVEKSETGTTESTQATNNSLNPEDYMAEYVAKYEMKISLRKEKTKAKAKEKQKKKGLMKFIKTPDEADNNE